MFNNIYKNKRVLIFGNTGFVGSNMCQFLLECGAEIYGFSNIKYYMHFDLLNIIYYIVQIYSEIEYYENVKKYIEEIKPDIIINLAAQALVKESYKNPKQTYETNILGTLNILEALRELNIKTVFLNITTDKVYLNKEQEKGYIESDEINGYDPYSNSKSCVEFITESYRNCFFNLNEYGKTHNTLIATLRSGNILGFGDMCENRLIPDIMKSYHNKEKLIIRYPNAIRPWIFVMDTIMGYLKVGEKLLEGKKEFSGAWNFSSDYSDMITVVELLNKIKKYIDIDFEVKEEKQEKETNILKLDSTKARTMLNWKPKYNIDQTLEETIMWYKEYYKNNKIITINQIKEYMEI